MAQVKHELLSERLGVSGLVDHEAQLVEHRRVHALLVVREHQTVLSPTRALGAAFR